MARKSDSDYEYKFNPVFRADTPEFRSFSQRNQQLLDLAHPNQSSGILLGVPLTIFAGFTTYKIYKLPGLPQNIRRYVVGAGGFATLASCAIVFMTIAPMKLITQSPQFAEMWTYLEKHDKDDWRYRYVNRPLIKWMGNVVKEDDPMFYGRPK